MRRTSVVRWAIVAVALAVAAALVCLPATAEAYDHIQIESAPVVVDADTPRWIGFSVDAGAPIVTRVGVAVNPVSWLSLEARAGFGLAALDLVPAWLVGGQARLRVPLVGAHHIVGAAGASAGWTDPSSCDGTGCRSQSVLLVDLGAGWAWLADDVEFSVIAGAVYTHALEEDVYPFPVAPALSLGVTWWPWRE